MPARQYIGARYVTKVYENSLDPSSAEWEAGINYEPLTMVTYNMGSYLSKKDVPASVGDPASNPQYWAQTGFYNGQIAYLDSIKQNKTLETAVQVGGEGRTTVQAALTALAQYMQPRALDVPITVNGSSKSTVEDALSAINTYVDNIRLRTTSTGTLLRTQSWVPDSAAGDYVAELDHVLPGDNVTIIFAGIKQIENIRATDGVRVYWNEDNLYIRANVQGNGFLQGAKIYVEYLYIS